jgi:hypothetical protein
MNKGDRRFAYSFCLVEERTVNVYSGSEPWRRVYEFGNQVSGSWRVKRRSVKRPEKPRFPKCV